MPGRPIPISALIDLSVLRHGVLTQSAEVKKTVTWGDRTETVTLAGWERKPDVPPDQAWRRKQVECLPTLARLAREGVLRLYSYIELAFEEWRGQRGMSGSFGDLFAGIEVEKVTPAVERSHFRQTVHLKEHVSKEALTEFCTFLLDLDPSALQQAPEFWDTLPDFEKANLAQVDRFQHLCRNLTVNHYADAFHLWTAEVNGLDFFLMVEIAFPNAVRNKRDLGFHCQPITPEELLHHAGVTDLDPRPFPDTGSHTYFD